MHSDFLLAVSRERQKGIGRSRPHSGRDRALDYSAPSPKRYGTKRAARIGVEISGARFHRAWHVGSVPHNQYKTASDSPNLRRAVYGSIPNKRIIMSMIGVEAV